MRDNASMASLSLHLTGEKGPDKLLSTSPLALLGDVEESWKGAENGSDLLRRMKALPGFGEMKAKIFIALLGKQLGITTPGWEKACAPYGEKGSFRSVADIVDLDSLEKVREFKAAAKKAAKASR